MGDDLFSLPELPYAGTSGWSGSDTSEARAKTADRDGTTRDRQGTVLRILACKGATGATWRDIAEEMGWHHGTSSGALSTLHKAGRIERLSEKRDRCKVYVLSEFVNGRETERHGGRLTGSGSNATEVRMLSEQQADVLINDHDTLVHHVERALTASAIPDPRAQAESAIAAVADWLAGYRPPDLGDDYCPTLDVTAFILRKGEFRG